MSRLPRVCVIGAGASGIAAAKALHERGFDFDCFEKSDRVGGNWVFKNRNGMSAAYRSLHINTWRERMRFADFPHHTHIAAYFDAYVDHCGFRHRITFEPGVERAAPDVDGTWEVVLDDGRRRAYDALVVANGHHWNPRRPTFEGSDAFAGVQLHAHDYTGEYPDLFRDRRVVVLGMGNSAMDIAAESSFSAAATYLAARRGAWIVPKYVFGRPLDQIFTRPGDPFRVRQLAAHAILRVAVGDMQRYWAFFAFIVEDPARFAFMRSNLDTVRDRFGDACSPRAPRSWPRSFAPRSPRATSRRSTSSTARTR